MGRVSIFGTEGVRNKVEVGAGAGLFIETSPSEKLGGFL